jgi:fatty acid-binding protein DegV
MRVGVPIVLDSLEMHRLKKYRTTTSATSKGVIYEVLGRYAKAHYQHTAVVHFAGPASRTATEMACLNRDVEEKADFFGRARQYGCGFRPV